MVNEKDSRETWHAELSKHDHSDPQEETNGNAESDSVIVADGENRTSLFVWLLVTCSSISGLLFGGFFPLFHFDLQSAITYIASGRLPGQHPRLRQ